MITWIILVLLAAVGLRAMFIYRKLETDQDQIDESNPEKMREEWYNLSWSGKNPFRVIALANEMAFEMDEFDGNKHMASSFYSQVKYLVRGYSPLAAVLFFHESRKAARRALEIRNSVPPEKRKPIDLEVLGALDFMLAKAPYVGRLIGVFGFKKRALEFLRAAHSELEEILKEPGARRPEPIAAALIWSKLYALTGNEFYKNRVRIAGLTGREDKGQLIRIMKHLGFESLDNLYEFCNI